MIFKFIKKYIESKRKEREIFDRNFVIDKDFNEVLISCISNYRRNKEGK